MNQISIDKISKSGQTLFIFSSPVSDFVSLYEFVVEHKVEINNYLLQSGGVLFRGFEFLSTEEFLKVKEEITSRQDFSYVDGNSPRTKLSNSIYTSTEYPKEYRIPLHNEMSYSSKWPSTLFFYCEIPSSKGGETPIVDSRLILKELGSGIVDPFEEYGVMYTRYLNGTGKFGKSWMDTFQTSDKSTVENFCLNNKIEFRWEQDSLFLSQFGHGVFVHPETHQKVWFNQADQFHPSSLPQDVYAGLKLLYGNIKHKFPQYSLYGNGEEIPIEHIKAITEVHFDCSLKFNWQKGDLLVLDNVLMAHGRMPFSGERKILVSMA